MQRPDDAIICVKAGIATADQERLVGAYLLALEAARDEQIKHELSVTGDRLECNKRHCPRCAFDAAMMRAEETP